MYSLSDVITKSLKLAWKHKILWVLALMLGGMSFNSNGGGGSSSSTSDTYDSKEDYKQERSYNNIQNNPELSFKNVLGEATQRIPSNMMGDLEVEQKIVTETNDNIEHLTPTTSTPDYSTMFIPFLKEINYFYAGLLGFILLALLIFAMFVSIFVISWATGAFIGGLRDAIDEKDYSLWDLGTYGRTSMKEVFKYRLALTLTGVLLTLLILIMILVVSVSESYLIFVPFGLILLPLFLGLILLGAADKFTVRYIVLKNQEYVKSIKDGVRYIFRNFLKYFILAIANCFVVGLIGLVAVIALVAIGAITILPIIGIGPDKLDPSVIVLLAMLAVPFIIMFIVLFTALSGYLNTYKNFTWSMFFNFGAYEEDQRIKDLPVNPIIVSQNLDGGSNGN